MQHLNNTKVLTIKVWREAYNKRLQTLKAEKSPTKSKASLFSDLDTLIEAKPKPQLHPHICHLWQY